MARSANCASNLRSLWQSHYNYMNVYGGKEKRMPPATGGEFWLILAKTPRPLIDKADIFFCPLTGNRVTTGRTDFRGPAKDVNTLAEEDAVGADIPGNHGSDEGGNVLLKLGSVQGHSQTEAAWLKADRTTKP